MDFVRLRALIGLLIPLAFAVLFVWLGLWQLARHQERAIVSVSLTSRLDAPPSDLSELPTEPESARWRRVTLSGRFRYDLEQVLGGRTNAGSPGVHLITPFELAGRDTLVAVTRGWVYSPDAAAVDLKRWREAESVSIAGYVLPLPEESALVAEGARPLRTLDRRSLEARSGRPFAAIQVVMTSDSVARIDSVPRRLALPVPDGGPHFSYMLQWFAFALIAIVGGVLLYRRSRSEGSY